MKIAVCIKQVVTREWQLRVNETQSWVRDQDASFELNEPEVRRERLDVGDARSAHQPSQQHPRNSPPRGGWRRGILRLVAGFVQSLAPVIEVSQAVRIT